MTNPQNPAPSAGSEERGGAGHPGWRIGAWMGRCNRADHRVPHPGPGGPDGCTYTYAEEDGPDLICGEPSQGFTIIPDLVGLVGEERARLIAAAPDMLAELKRCLMGCGDRERIASLIAEAERKG